MESRKRSIAKTVSWRALATLMTFGIAFVFTKSVFESTVLAIALNVTKAVVYYIHERVWTSVKWGYQDVGEMASDPRNESVPEKGE